MSTLHIRQLPHGIVIGIVDIQTVMRRARRNVLRIHCLTNPHCSILDSDIFESRKSLRIVNNNSVRFKSDDINPVV